MNIEATVRAEMAREAAGGSSQQQFGQSGFGLAFGFLVQLASLEKQSCPGSPMLVPWSNRGASNLGESE